MSPAFVLTRRVTQLLVGLFAYGIAISLMVQAGIGVAPWDVLTQGLSKPGSTDGAWGEIGALNGEYLSDQG
jgi:uncharacterized membrane protein YczE